MVALLTSAANDERPELMCTVPIATPPGAVEIAPTVEPEMFTVSCCGT
jgi:hypothetical protein